jgi:hypothetical protein
MLAGAARAHPTQQPHGDEARVLDRLRDEFLEPARQRLGTDEWDRAAQRGAALTLRDLLDLAQRRDAAAV